LFSSNEASIIKFENGDVYMGNIDILLNPDDSDGSYFAFDYTGFNADSIDEKQLFSKNASTSFTSDNWFKTFSVKDDSKNTSTQYIYKWLTDKYDHVSSDVGNIIKQLAIKKEPVRMKYKSSPHIAFVLNSAITNKLGNWELPVLELYKEVDENTIFGGKSKDALKANMWLPAGKAVDIQDGQPELYLTYEWGDTWFNRYDCLKTYPFTNEDINQVIEIGSFVLESRVNPDGRYDRNRGQVSNLHMSPVNFNKMNPVYSQRDNFFNYRILDDSFYELNDFPNQITWSTEKTAGQDVDPWTTVTLAATYDMDGSKGKIRALNVWNDNIYCFQDSGVSNILFNSRVQIPTSDGVPIEISNNYKVDGKRYISDGMGCINKYAICPSPSALYFIDSVGGHLQAIGSQGLSDLSSQRNMITWFGKQDSSLWTPNNYSTKLFYDKNKNDLYITNKEESLCYNEQLQQFTSFYSYPKIPIMFNVVDTFYCINDNLPYKMFDGNYNYFFNEYQGYDISFVSNGRSSQQDLSGIDKIYANVFFRGDRWSDKLDSILSSESPFDYIRVWDEYQDTGETLLKNNGHMPSILKKKFRVWRAQIPRDAHNRRDRIRNTWCKVKLGAAPRYNNGNNGFIQLHDVEVQYFI
jgi:hypothetical protein